MNGVLCVDKPKGLASFKVLQQIRKKLDVKKVGYLGTLDPLATGLLVFFIGKATRLIPYFSDVKKEYQVAFELGKSSDTFDITGAVVEHALTEEQIPSKHAIKEVLDIFLGPQLQIQPPFSAINYQGRRAYELAREGKSFNLGKRQIEIFELSDLSGQYPQFSLHMQCSSGTYVRSFVHELGEKLGCGAVMLDLRRTRVGPFAVDSALQPDSISTSALLSCESIVKDFIDWTGHSASEKDYLLKKICSQS